MRLFLTLFVILPIIIAMENGLALSSVLKSIEYGNSNQNSYGPMIFYSKGQYVYDQAKFYSEKSNSYTLISGIEFFSNKSSKALYGERSNTSVTIPLNDDMLISRIIVSTGSGLDSIMFSLKNLKKKIRIGGEGGKPEIIFPITDQPYNQLYRIVGFYGSSFQNNSTFGNLYASFGFYYQNLTSLTDKESIQKSSDRVFNLEKKMVRIYQRMKYLKNVQQKTLEGILNFANEQISNKKVPSPTLDSLAKLLKEIGKKREWVKNYSNSN